MGLALAPGGIGLEIRARDVVHPRPRRRPGRRIGATVAAACPSASATAASASVTASWRSRSISVIPETSRRSRLGQRCTPSDRLVGRLRITTRPRLHGRIRGGPRPDAIEAHAVPGPAGLADALEAAFDLSQRVERPALPQRELGHGGVVVPAELRLDRDAVEELAQPVELRRRQLEVARGDEERHRAADPVPIRIDRPDRAGGDALGGEPRCGLPSTELEVHLDPVLTDDAAVGARDPDGIGLGDATIDGSSRLLRRPQKVIASLRFT